MHAVFFIWGQALSWQQPWKVSEDTIWVSRKRWGDKDKEWTLIRHWLSIVPWCKCVSSPAVVSIGPVLLHLADDQQHIIVFKDLIMLSKETSRAKINVCSVWCFLNNRTMTVLCILSLMPLFSRFSITTRHDYEQVALSSDYQCKLSRSAAPQMCLCFAEPFIIAFFIYGTSNYYWAINGSCIYI